MKMHYRSITDLNTSIVNNLHLLHGKYDLIVGIPRSGMLAANIIALHMNLPMTDIQQFKEKKVMNSGARMNGKEMLFDKIKNVLIVDDSANTGNSLMETKEALEGYHPEKNINYATVYKNPDLDLKGDLYLDACPMPRIFEWNIMNHPYISSACVEIDGVLCQPPQPKDIQDENSYRRYLLNAKPLLSCNTKIGTLVSNRPNKFRPETEEWLQNNSIQYDELKMQKNTSNPDIQSTSKKSLNYKANIYKEQIDARLFIENSYEEATGIVRLTGRPVFCVSQKEMIQPDFLSVKRRRTRSLINRILDKFL